MADLPQLICLPPAGAGPSIFHSWKRQDPAVTAPSIPGREARFREAPAADLPALANQITVDIVAGLQSRYGLFGYSMGGTVAMLLAQRLIALERSEPEALFLLGALSPDHLHDGTEGLHLLDSATFWNEIERMGGTPDEILHDKEMRALFEPALRDDFRICDSYTHPEGAFRLSCPVHVFVARDDHLVGEDSAEHWAQHTSGPTHLHVLEGGHMLSAGAFAALHRRIRDLWPKTAVQHEDTGPMTTSRSDLRVS